MSLKVWLPLDGDLRNLGTDNITFTQNTGATVTNTGKIGQCYFFDGNDDLLQWQFDKTKYDYKPISVACWFKCDKTKTGSALIDLAADLNLAYTYSSSGINFGYWLCYANTSGTRVGASGYTSTFYNADVWHHVVVVFGAGKETIYVDGKFSQEIDHTASYTNYWHPLLAASYNKITLAKSTGTPGTAGTNYWAGGLLNDVRIYDHCLSAAEVHEIAQGLVLHYKLDNGSQEIITSIPSTNVYNYPTFNTASVNGGWNHWGPSGHSGNYGQNTDKKYIYNKNNIYSHWIMEDAGTESRYLLYQSPSFEGGYRSIQAIIKEENSLPITESICYPTWNARNGGVPNNKWTSIEPLGDGFYYCRAEGASQDGSNNLFGIYSLSGYKIYVSECYLENDTETCSPIFSYSSNVIQDSSGYNHNGALNSSLTLNTDSPRYSSSSYFSPNIIATSNNLFSQGTLLSEFTWAGWVRRKYDDGKYKVIYYGPANIGLYTDYSLYIGWVSAKTDGTTTANGAAGGSATVPLNTWTHICITYKDGIGNFYINGNKTKTFNYTSYGTFIEAYGQNYLGASNWDGDLSDIRIYTTALLDNDIKLLYNIGMRADNLGEVHAFELNEKQSNLFRSELIQPFAKSGQTVGIGEIVTHNDTYAMNIRPAPFYQNLENNVSGTLKGYFAPNTSYIFDMWIDVDNIIPNGNNAKGGFYIRYTDGTSDTTFNLIGGNQGYQHKRLITPNNKTIDRLEIYYYTSLDIFYRLDSYICPISQTKLYKNGTIESSSFTENINKVQIIKGSSIHNFTTIEI